MGRTGWILTVAAGAAAVAGVAYLATGGAAQPEPSASPSAGGGASGTQPPDKNTSGFEGTRRS